MTFQKLEEVKAAVEAKEKMQRDEALKLWGIVHPYAGDTRIHMCPTSYYSTMLHQVFRSKMEGCLAHIMVKEWGWDVSYEPHLFEMDSYKYVPDFYIVKNHVWMEVKGEWRTSGKTKLRKAQALLGEDRILLLGPELQQEIYQRGSRL